MRKSIKWLAALLGLLILGMTLSIIAYFYIHSPNTLANLRPKIQETLKQKLGVDSKIGEIRMDLFRSIELENVAAQIESEDLSASLDIKNVKLRYSPWAYVSRGELEIHEIVVAGGQFVIQADATEGSEDDPSKSSSPETLNVADFLDRHSNFSPGQSESPTTAHY